MTVKAKRSKLENRIIKLSYDLIDMPQSRFKHFTFLVRRNRILNISVNNASHTHPICKKHGYKFEALHSEIAMLVASNRQYSHEFNKLKVYNVRINNEGVVALSAPCTNCETVLRLYGFREVYYTNANGVFEKIIL